MNEPGSALKADVMQSLKALAADLEDLVHLVDDDVDAALTGSPRFLAATRRQPRVSQNHA